MTTEYIDCTPTAEGYANMARMFAGSILSDVTSQERREACRVLLDSFVEIVAYLAVTEPRLIAELRKDITR